MGATEAVAQFVADAAGMVIPDEVLRRTKLALLDCVGVAIAGARFPSSQILLDFIRECGGATQAAIVGTRLRTSAADAAMANGMLSSALTTSKRTTSRKCAAACTT